MNLSAIQKGPFEPSFDSLREYTCPQWFRDAKFGIWSHWGLQSVPMAGDWYARLMYLEGTDQYTYHCRKYGHPSVFGYKDLIPLWKAERFDPEALMKLYVESGARYFVAQAMHHDNFFNYDSRIHRYNAAAMGPHRDIVAEWKAAADKYGLPFGISEHMGAGLAWSATNKGADTDGPYAGVPYDGNLPEYRDFYLDNRAYYRPGTGPYDVNPWMCPDEWWQAHWFEVIKEVIDKFHPDLLYSDSPLPFGEDMPQAGLNIVAHLYNTSIADHGRNQAVYNQKDGRPKIYRIGIRDVERGQLRDVSEHPWQTDTCVGNWFYNLHGSYKKPAQVIEMLVDIVAKNGNLLLNIPQRPDGTIDDECRYILREVGSWLKQFGEGIYQTRPLSVAGEGPSQTAEGHFNENRIAWTGQDIRFTRRDDHIYAFLMAWPENEVHIHTLAQTNVQKVELLGYGDVAYRRQNDALTVKLPARPVTPYIHCLKATVKD